MLQHLVKQAIALPGLGEQLVVLVVLEGGLEILEVEAGPGAGCKGALCQLLNLEVGHLLLQAFRQQPLSGGAWGLELEERRTAREVVDQLVSGQEEEVEHARPTVDVALDVLLLTQVAEVF
jgi:hypothetical protein